MILDSVLSLKTDERILKAVDRNIEKRMTSEEIAEQRVSFVISSMGGERGGMTKDHVRSVMLKQGGLAYK